MAALTGSPPASEADDANNAAAARGRQPDKDNGNAEAIAALAAMELPPLSKDMAAQGLLSSPTVQNVFLGAARSAVGGLLRNAASAVPFSSVGIALCSEAAGRVAQLKANREDAAALAKRAGLVARRGPRLVLYFEAHDDAEARAEAEQLLVSAFSAFRLTSDLAQSKGVARKIVLFLGCKQAAEALQATAEHLRDCAEAVLFCAVDDLAGESLAKGASSEADALSSDAKVLLQLAGALGDEAARFWHSNNFGAKVDVDDLVDALCSHVASTGATAADPDEAPELLAFFTRGRDLQVTSVQRFQRFLTGSPSLAAAVEKYTTTTGGAPPADLSHLRKATLQPVSFGDDLVRLQSDFVAGTRAWVFDLVETWMALPPGDVHHRALWLQGPAGLGKSAVAAQLVVRYGGEGGGEEAPARARLLAAHFFCRHDDDARNSVRRVLATLAFRLAAQVPAVGAVWDRMLADEAMRSKAAACVSTDEGTLEEAFELLLAGPLREALKGAAADQGDIFILIDALDELRTGAQRAALLKLLGGKVLTLPPQVRILVTSRPEGDIVEALGSLRPLQLEPEDEKQRADLALYFEARVVPETALAGAAEAEREAALTAMQDGAGGVFLAAKLLGTALLRQEGELRKEGKAGLATAEEVKAVVSGKQGLELVYATYAAELRRIDARLQSAAAGDDDALGVLRAALRRTGGAAGGGAASHAGRGGRAQRRQQGGQPRAAQRADAALPRARGRRRRAAAAQERVRLFAAGR